MAFQGFLKEDTATTLKLGPFVDMTNGVTYEVGMAAAMNHATTGVRISKNGGAFAARTTATEPVYDAFGYYLVNLDITDTGTPGRLKVIFGDAAVCLPCEADFEIVAANVFDSLFSTAAADLLDVNQAQVLGTAVHAASEAGTQCVEVVRWGGNDIAATAVNGVPKVALTHVNAAAQTATLDTIKAETVEILTDTAVIGALGAGLTALATQASVDAVKAETALIVADTNELQVDDYPTSIAAVKADTAAILLDTTVIGATGEGLTSLSTQVSVDNNALSIAAISGTIGVNGAGLTDLPLEDVWTVHTPVIGIDAGLSLDRIYEMVNNKMNVTDATGVVALRNIADNANIATGSVTDDLTTTVRAVLTWA